MLIAETDFKHRVEEDIKPFHDILLGLFFITIGMKLDWIVLGKNWHIVLLLADRSSSRQGVAHRGHRPCFRDPWWGVDSNRNLSGAGG
jgi:CPA2 family monovalent cation:H+ antiporter-2